MAIDCNVREYAKIKKKMFLTYFGFYIVLVTQIRINHNLRILNILNTSKHNLLCQLRENDKPLLVSIHSYTYLYTPTLKPLKLPGSCQILT